MYNKNYYSFILINSFTYLEEVVVVVVAVLV